MKWNNEIKGTAKKPSHNKKRFFISDIFGYEIITGIVDIIDGVTYPLTPECISEYQKLALSDKYFQQILEIYANWKKEEAERAQA